jgi:hypothetical protein
MKPRKERKGRITDFEDLGDGGRIEGEVMHYIYIYIYSTAQHSYLQLST